MKVFDYGFDLCGFNQGCIFFFFNSKVPNLGCQGMSFIFLFEILLSLCFHCSSIFLTSSQFILGSKINLQDKRIFVISFHKLLNHLRTILFWAGEKDFGRLNNSFFGMNRRRRNNFGTCFFILNI